MSISTFSSPRNVQLGDTLLINRGGVSYYVDVTELAAKVEDDDLLLVNYAGASYRCRYGDIDDAADNVILLVNRAGSSYYTTLGSLRGVISQDITFSVKLTSPSSVVSSGGSRACGTGDVRTWTPGAVITALFTTKDRSSYSFEAFNPGNGSLFKIANEWMLCAGGGGTGTVTTNIGGEYCTYVPTASSPALGFSAQGVKDLSPGSGPDGKYYQGVVDNTLGSGAGCPGSTIVALNYWGVSSPGWSQYRTNAESSGDSFNGVKFETTPQFSANSVNFDELWTPDARMGPLYYEITFNGITKFYKAETTFVQDTQNTVVTGDLPLTGILDDLRDWS